MLVMICLMRMRLCWFLVIAMFRSWRRRGRMVVVILLGCLLVFGMMDVVLCVMVRLLRRRCIGLALMVLGGLMVSCRIVVRLIRLLCLSGRVIIPVVLVVTWSVR